MNCRHIGISRTILLCATVVSIPKIGEFYISENIYLAIKNVFYKISLTDAVQLPNVIRLGHENSGRWSNSYHAMPQHGNAGLSQHDSQHHSQHDEARERSYHDHSHDPRDPDRDNIPGYRHIDYPHHPVIPHTSFRCADQPYRGYYADTEAHCQVFHYCPGPTSSQQHYSGRKRRNVELGGSAASFATFYKDGDWIPQYRHHSPVNTTCPDKLCSDQFGRLKRTVLPAAPTQLLQLPLTSSAAVLHRDDRQIQQHRTDKPEEHVNQAPVNEYREIVPESSRRSYGESLGHQNSHTFICPTGTIFHQKYLVCVWWYQFDCSTAKELYHFNNLAFGNPGDTVGNSVSGVNLKNLGSEAGGNSYAIFNAPTGNQPTTFKTSVPVQPIVHSKQNTASTYSSLNGKREATGFAVETAPTVDDILDVRNVAPHVYEELFLFDQNNFQHSDSNDVIVPKSQSVDISFNDNKHPNSRLHKPIPSIIIGKPHQLSVTASSKPFPERPGNADPRKVNLGNNAKRNANALPAGFGYSASSNGNNFSFTGDKRGGNKLHSPKYVSPTPASHPLYRSPAVSPALTSYTTSHHFISATTLPPVIVKAKPVVLGVHKTTKEASSDRCKYSSAASFGSNSNCNVHSTHNIKAFKVQNAPLVYSAVTNHLPPTQNIPEFFSNTYKFNTHAISNKGNVETKSKPNFNARKEMLSTYSPGEHVTSARDHDYGKLSHGITLHDFSVGSKAGGFSYQKFVMGDSTLGQTQIRHQDNHTPNFDSVQYVSDSATESSRKGVSDNVVLLVSPDFDNNENYNSHLQPKALTASAVQNASKLNLGQLNLSGISNEPQTSPSRDLNSSSKISRNVLGAHYQEFVTSNHRNYVNPDFSKIKDAEERNADSEHMHDIRLSSINEDSEQSKRHVLPTTSELKPSANKQHSVVVRKKFIGPAIRQRRKIKKNFPYLTGNVPQSLNITRESGKIDFEKSYFNQNYWPPQKNVTFPTVSTGLKDKQVSNIQGNTFQRIVWEDITEKKQRHPLVLKNVHQEPTPEKSAKHYNSDRNKPRSFENVRVAKHYELFQNVARNESLFSDRVRVSHESDQKRELSKIKHKSAAASKEILASKIIHESKLLSREAESNFDNLEPVLQFGMKLSPRKLTSTKTEV